MMTRHHLRTALPTVHAGALQAWGSRPWISTADFAEQHFRLVVGPDAGQFFRHDRSPYARPIMDLWDRPWTRKMFVAAPSQTTKTTIAYACLAAELHRDPSPAGVGMPDEATAKRVIEEKLGPHFEKSPELRADLAARNAVQATKILLKGARIYAMWSGSESSMSSVTMRVVVIDEEDAYGDASAASTMEERAISYPDDCKIMRISKPRGTEAESTLFRDLKRQAQAIYQWEAVCPDCGHRQVMDVKNIVVPEDVRDPAEIRGKRLARYRCAGCGSLWSDHKRNRAVAAGRLVTDSPVERPEIVAVHLPSWNSPQISLSTVLAAWFEAHQSGLQKEKIKFDNDHRAVPGNVVALVTDADRVRQMITDRPPMIVPAEAWCLTCGIDVQMVGFWFAVRAWARDYTSWLVQYGFLDAWPDVERLLDSTWPVEGRDDIVMGLWRAGIDTGGHEKGQTSHGWSQSEETKSWLYEQEGRGIVYGTKGASARQDAVVRAVTAGVDPELPAGMQSKIVLRLIDTDYLKCQIQARMQRDAHIPMWLHRETGDDYIRQICAERQIQDKQGRLTWEARGANHLLDCEVIASACVHVDWAPNMRQALAQPDWRFLRKHRAAPPENTRSPLYGRRINPNAR